MTYPFPTGHFIQEVIRPREWEIIGVAKTNDDIQEKIFDIKKFKKIFRQKLKEFKSGQSKGIEATVIKEFFDATQEWFVSNISGGAAHYMRRFFPDNGFYTLDI